MQLRFFLSDPKGIAGEQRRFKYRWSARAYMDLEELKGPFQLGQWLLIKEYLRTTRRAPLPSVLDDMDDFREAVWEYVDEHAMMVEAREKLGKNRGFSLRLYVVNIEAQVATELCDNDEFSHV